LKRFNKYFRFSPPLSMQRYCRCPIVLLSGNSSFVASMHDQSPCSSRQNS